MIETTKSKINDVDRGQGEEGTLEDLDQRRLKILFIGSVWPERGSSAAGLRSENLLDACIESGFSVVYASASPSNLWSERLETLGVRLWRVALNDSVFDEGLKELQPDVVVYDRFLLEEQFGARVRDSLPNAVEWIDTQDLHSVRKWRMEGHTQFPTSTYPLLLREIASILRVDRSLILSDEELRFLVRDLMIPESKVLHSPFWLEPSNLTEIPPFEERRDFLFIGNFRHPPNPDGLQWFFREIWPRVRSELPEARIQICGAYPPKSAQQWNRPREGMIWRGPVPMEQIAALYASVRVNLAPLRFGAGLKGKIAEGWSYGVPVVSTPIGLEGYRTHSTPGIEANTPEEFARAMVLLYSSKAAWTDAQSKIFAYFESETGLLSSSRGKRRWIRALVDSVLEKDTRRATDLIGNLLRLESVNSARYFSRWLEVKNRLNNIEKSV